MSQVRRITPPERPKQWVGVRELALLGSVPSGSWRRAQWKQAECSSSPVASHAPGLAPEHCKASLNHRTPFQAGCPWMHTEFLAGYRLQSTQPARSHRFRGSKEPYFLGQGLYLPIKYKLCVLHAIFRSVATCLVDATTCTREDRTCQR